MPISHSSVYMNTVFTYMKCYCMYVRGLLHQGYDVQLMTCEICSGLEQLLQFAVIVLYIKIQTVKLCSCFVIGTLLWFCTMLVIQLEQLCSNIENSS